MELLIKQNLTFRLNVNALRMGLRTKLLEVEGLTVRVHMFDDVGVFISLEPAIVPVKLDWNVSFEQSLESLFICSFGVDELGLSFVFYL